MFCGLLETGHGGSINTMEVSKHHKSGLELLFGGLPMQKVMESNGKMLVLQIKRKSVPCL